MYRTAGRSINALASRAEREQAPPTYGSGRVCAASGCGTVLSSYNPSPVCCLHKGGWAEEERVFSHCASPRPELVMICANDRCGIEFITTNPARKFCSDRCRMAAFQARKADERRQAALGAS